MNSGQFPRLHILCYGSIALPLAFAGIPLYIHAPDFYAMNHGLSLTDIGIVLLAVRIFDAIQDPLIGILSDRYKKYRHTILTFFLAALGIGFFLLFHPPKPVSLSWFALTILLTTVSFSVLTINVNALGGIWTNDANEQTRITTTREAIGLVGLMLASIAPNILQQYENADAAFHHVSLLLFALIIAAGILFSRWMTKYGKTLATHSPSFSFKPLWSIMKQQWLFYTIYAVNAVASSIPATLVLFYIRDRIGAESYSGLFLMLYFIAGVAGMPLWQAAAKRLGKHQCWLLSMVLAICSFFWAAFLTNGDMIQYGLVCVASGLALGAELALPPSILADAMHRANSGSSATTQFSVLAFLSKAALALAAGICLPLLESAGYRTGAENSTAALQWLSLLYAILPCMLKIIAAGMLYFMILHHRKGNFYEKANTGRMPDWSHNDTI